MHKSTAEPKKANEGSILNTLSNAKIPIKIPIPKTKSDAAIVLLYKFSLNKKSCEKQKGR